MKTIFFIRGHSAYLPEVTAYQEYAFNLGFKVKILNELNELPSSPDIVWYFCGMPKPLPTHVKNKPFTIHEYASASIGKFPSLKDFIKSRFSTKPDYRIFLNPFVKDSLSFKDAIPYEYRDMGVPRNFFEELGEETVSNSNQDRKFDLIYVGETNRLLPFTDVLKVINSLDLSLYVIGRIDDKTKKKLKGFQNIILAGQIPQHDVIHKLKLAKVGLNLIPNKRPYNQQTSTKLIEYCAAKLPIISNEYCWVKEFCKQGHQNISLFSSDNMLESFDIAFQNSLILSDNALELSQSKIKTWEYILAPLKIWSKLQNISSKP